MLGRTETAFYMRPRVGYRGEFIYELRRVWTAAWAILLGGAALAMLVWLLHDTFGDPDWGNPALYVMGALGLVFLLVGLSAAFSYRRLVVNRDERTLEMVRVTLLWRRTFTWPWEEAALRVRPTTITESRGPDWHGHTLLIEMPGARFSIARTRDENRIWEIAAEAAEQLGLPPAEAAEAVEYSGAGGMAQTE